MSRRTYNDVFVDFVERNRIIKKDLAVDLGVSTQTLRRWYKAGEKLPFYAMVHMQQKYGLNILDAMREVGDLKPGQTLPDSSQQAPESATFTQDDIQKNLNQVVELEAQKKLLRDQLREKDIRIERLSEEKGRAIGERAQMGKMDMVMKAMAKKLKIPESNYI